MLRQTVLVLALTLATGAATAQTWSVEDRRLPEMGSSAAQLLTPAKRVEYGSMMLAQMRHYNLVLDDPMLDRWLSGTGANLGKHSARPADSFRFFLLRDRQINAFATLGGYIGVNSGLVLAAQNEDEVASVLGHEIAHVTQDHVLRSVERSQRDQLPVLLAMLGAIAAAQAGGNSSGNAAMAIMTGAMGLAQQRQINYTRSGEQEADRIGMQTLIRSGYNANAMAEFFATLQNRMRANSANYYGEEPPEYLMTHPVTTNRISDARALAQQYMADPAKLKTGAPIGAGIGNTNSLLPSSLRVSSTAMAAATAAASASSGPRGGDFAFAKERLRVLSEEQPGSSLREYQAIEKRGALTDAQRYGKAVALMRAQGGANIAQSMELLRGLAGVNAGNLWIRMAEAESLSRSGQTGGGDAIYLQLLREYPGDRAVSLTYADSLTNRQNKASAQQALQVLRPLEDKLPDDPMYWLSLARAYQAAGDEVRAGLAFAENAYVRGLTEQALVQYETIKRRTDLDYYARARADARIAEIKPMVLELRRRGLEDPDLHGRKQDPDGF